jgi:hypothetical protein
MEPTEEVPEDSLHEDSDLELVMDELALTVAAIEPPTVLSPSGAEIKLLSDGEKEFYEQIAARYLEDNILSNISDLQELDRILVMEAMIYRWSQWLLEEKDYFGEPVSVADLQKNISDYSKEIRLVKKALGIDKATREKEHGETVADYIHNLKLRAQEFGVVRNQQAYAAITLWQELVGIITFHLNSSPDERNEFKANERDVIEWIISKLPEFNKIDEEFRESSQKIWIRKISIVMSIFF